MSLVTQRALTVTCLDQQLGLDTSMLAVYPPQLKNWAQASTRLQQSITSNRTTFFPPLDYVLLKSLWSVLFGLCFLVAMVIYCCPSVPPTQMQPPILKVHSVGPREMTQLVKRLRCKREDRSSDPQHPHKTLGTVHRKCQGEGTRNQIIGYVGTGGRSGDLLQIGAGSLSRGWRCSKFNCRDGYTIL